MSASGRSQALAGVAKLTRHGSQYAGERWQRDRGDQAPDRRPILGLVLGAALSTARARPPLARGEVTVAHDAIPRRSSTLPTTRCPRRRPARRPADRRGQPSTARTIRSNGRVGMAPRGAGRPLAGAPAAAPGGLVPSRSGRSWSGCRDRRAARRPAEPGADRSASDACGAPTRCCDRDAPARPAADPAGAAPAAGAAAVAVRHRPPALDGGRPSARPPTAIAPLDRPAGPAATRPACRPGLGAGGALRRGAAAGRGALRARDPGPRPGRRRGRCAAPAQRTYDAHEAAALEAASLADPRASTPPRTPPRAGSDRRSGSAPTRTRSRPPRATG